MQLDLLFITFTRTLGLGNARYHLSLKETLLFPPYRYNKRQRCFLFRKRKWLSKRKSELAPRKLQWLQWDCSDAGWWRHRHQQCKQRTQCESGGEYAATTTTNHTNIPSKYLLVRVHPSLEQKVAHLNEGPPFITDQPCIFIFLSTVTQILK